MLIKLGTRQSKLAIAQAQEVAHLLENLGHQCQIITILTSGDKIKDKNLYDIGGKALFLKEIEEALIAKQIDIAVHSFKDVPGQIPDDLLIAAVLERKSANDMLLCFNAKTIAQLPLNATVGTSSVRRKSILLKHRPDLNIVNCRGNITLRIEKFLNKDYDAIVLAASGLERLNIIDYTYCHMIPEKDMLPAVAQGVIALEIRKDDNPMLELCKLINHSPTWKLLAAERSFLETLQADCRTPLAALAKLVDNKVHVSFMLATLDGANIYTHQAICDIADGREVGIEAAKKLMLLASS